MPPQTPVNAPISFPPLPGRLAIVRNRLAVIAKVEPSAVHASGLVHLVTVDYTDLEGAHEETGEGWMLPETLRLSDYGLGHDDRAREPQPVASRLGPRFHAWQLEGTVEESWEECSRHAALIRTIRSHGQAVASPDSRPPVSTSDSPAAVAGPTNTKRRGCPSASPHAEQTELF